MEGHKLSFEGNLSQPNLKREKPCTVEKLLTCKKKNDHMTISVICSTLQVRSQATVSAEEKVEIKLKDDRESVSGNEVS